MKKVLGLAVSCLSVLGIASLFNVQAEETAPVEKNFTDLQTASKLKFTYNDTTFDYSNVRIKFGGEVTKDVVGYENLENYTYGVAVVKYTETSEKELSELTVQGLADYKKNGYAIECPINPETTVDGKFDFAWVIKNTDLNFKYSAAMYRTDKNNTTLEMAKPVSRSVSDTANAYLAKGETPELTPAVRTTLSLITDDLGVEYNVDEALLKSVNGNYAPAETDDLYAYSWGEHIAPHFTKVDRANGKIKLNALTKELLFVYAEQGKTPKFNPDENIKAKTSNLLISRNNIIKPEDEIITYNYDNNFMISTLKSLPTLPEKYDVWIHAWGAGDKDFKVTGNTFELEKKYTGFMFVILPENTEAFTWNGKLAEGFNLKTVNGSYELDSKIIKTDKDKIEAVTRKINDGEFVYAVCNEDGNPAEYWTKIDLNSNIEIAMPSNMNRIRFVIKNNDKPGMDGQQWISNYLEFSNGWVK